MASALSVVLYQTISGPMSSMVRVTNKTASKTQMQSVTSILIMDAVNQGNNGDCDADGSVEPREWRVGTYGPIGGGLVPLTIGAPVTDPWGTDYGYCVWDVGAAIKTVNACSHDSVAANAYRLSGSPTPDTGNALSQTVIAVISAGPNRQFQTTCRNYANNTIPADANTDVIVTVGDDIVHRYTYKEAASATNGLWTLKVGDTAKAVIGKDLEIGPAASLGSVPSDVSSSFGSGGIVNAAAVVTKGAMITGGALRLANETAVTSCVAANAGDVRYSTVSKSVEVCDGAGNWGPAGGALALSSLVAGTKANTLDSAGWAQTWTWNTLAGNSGLTLSSNSTAATGNAQTLLNLSLSGANATAAQTTYVQNISNAHTGGGTNVGLYASAFGGANNYAAIFDAGNVGIGTATPNARLAVGSPGNANSAIFGNGGGSTNDAVYGYITGTGRAVIGDSSGSGGMGVAGYSGSGYGGYFTSNTGPALVTGTGNVGINNTTPSHKLTVTGGAIGGNYGLTPTYAAWNAYGVGDGGSAIYNDNATYQALMVAGNTSAGGVRKINMYDDVAIAGNLSVAGSILGAGSLWNRSGTNTYLANSGDNVGIGTSTPGTKLDVNGRVRSSDYYESVNGLTSNLYYGGTPAWNYRANGDAWLMNMRADSGTAYLAYAGSGTAGAPATLTPSMSWTNTGNVGIGTSSPPQKLSVLGTLGISEAGGSGQRLLISTSGSGAVFNQNDNSNIYFQTQGSNWLTIQNTTGNVGIGTTNPARSLEVRKDQNAVTEAGVINSNTGASAIARFGLATGTGNSYALSQVSDNGGAPYYQLSTGIGVQHSYFDMPDYYFRKQDGTVWMHINSSGQLMAGPGADARGLMTLRSGGAAYTSGDPDDTRRNLSLTHNLAGAINILSMRNLANGKFVDLVENNGSLAFNEYGATYDTRMFIASGGNVGIGTTSPGSQLAIVSAAADTSGMSIVNTNAAGSANIFLNYSGTGGGVSSSNLARIWTPTNANDLYIGTGQSGGSGANIIFKSSVSSAGSYDTEIMRLTRAGLVGIGTASPGSKLTVTGGAIGGNYGLTPQYAAWNAYGVGDGGSAIYNDNATYQALMIAGNTSAGGVRKINMYDDVAIAGNLSVAGSILGAGSLWNRSGTNTYLANSGDNVGIGITNPSFYAITKGIDISGGKAGIRLDSTTGGSTGVEIWADTNGLNFQNMNSSRNFLFTTGNVGIGTSSPGTKLDVVPASLGAVAGNSTYPLRFTIANGGNNDAVDMLWSRTASSPTNWTTADFIIRRNVDGTAAQSAMAFTGDASVAFTTGTTERMRINGSGNVGIGTTSFNGLLNLSGDGGALNHSGVIRVFSTGGSKWSGITLPDALATTTASSNYYLIGRGNALTDRVLSIHLPNAGDYGSGVQPTFGVYSSGAVKLFEVEASTGRAYVGGNLGINNTAPGYKLTVTGGAIGGNYGLTPNYAAWGAYGVGDGGAAIYNDNGGYQALMLVGNNSAGGVRKIAMYDDVTVVGNLSVAGSIVGAGSLWSRSGTNTYLANSGDSVGIGTSSPGGPLEIKAAANGSGMLRLNSAAAGQYRFTRYLTNGSVRWDMGVDSSAESGSDAGSNFFLNRFSDAGSYLDTPLSVIRSTGNVGIATTPSERLHVNGNMVINSKLYAGGYYSTGAGSLNAFSLELGGAAPTSTNGQATLYLHDHGDIAHQLRYTVGTLYLEAAGNGYGTSSTPNLQVGGSLYAAVNGGNVGVGTTVANNRLQISSDNTAQALQFNTSGYIGANTWGTRMYKSDIGGGIPLKLETQSAGTWYASADFDHGLDNAHPSLKTWSNTQLAVNGGNVGVGTAAPQDKLHVIGADLPLAATDTANLVVGTSDAAADNKGGSIGFGHNTVTGALLATIKAGREAGGTNTGYLALATRNDSVFSTERMRITSAGNVGIGLTNPSSQLHVNNLTPAVSGIYLAGNSNTSWPASSYYSQDTGAGGRSYAFGSRNGIGFSISDETAAAIRMVINSAGNVGINNTSPGYKLTVTGGAIGGNYGLTPNYAAWATYGVGDGGAAIYNDNAGYQALMIVGNNSAGGVRRVTMYDDVTVVGNLSVAGSIVGAGSLWNRSGTNTYLANSGDSVGIGTSTPGTKLDVVGAIQSNTSIATVESATKHTIAYGGFLRIAQTAGSANWSEIDMYGGAAADARVWNMASRGDTGTFDFRALNDARSSATTPMYLTRIGDVIANRNVGIGTGAPVDKLTAYGSADAGIGLAAVNASNTANAYTYYGAKNDTGTGVYLFLNSSTRATDGGTGTATLRNDVGNLRLQSSGSNGLFVAATTGSVNIGSNAAPAGGNKFEVVGGTFSTHISRDGTSQCCSGGATLSLAETTSVTGKVANIQFHNSGVSEGYFQLANGGQRRFQIGDNQGVTTGLQMSGPLYVDGTGNSYVSGNLGIGTTGPSNKLHVSAGDSSIALFGPNTTWNSYLAIGAGGNQAAANKASVVSTNGNLHLDAGTGANMYLGWYTQTATFINAGGGNVGIGTTSPQGKLHVTGTAGALQDVGMFEVEDGSLNGLTVGYDTGNSMAWLYGRSRGVAARTININNTLYTQYAGNVGIGTATPGYKLHAVDGDGAMTYSDSPGLQVFNAEGTTGSVRVGSAWGKPGIYSSTALYLFSDGANPVYIGNANSEKVTVATSGNVGIGTTSPGQKLTVAGTIESTSGGVKFPDGTVQTTAGVSGANYVAKAGDTMTGNLAINNGAPTMYFQDTDHTSAVLHQNSNLFYILSAPVNSTSFAPNGGAWGFTHNTSNDVTTFGGDVNLAEGNLNLNTFAVTSNAGTVIDGGGGWHRTYGNTGWYNGTHGGGWYMTDSTWVRAYNGKSIYGAANAQFDGTLQVGGVSTLGYTVVNSDAIEAQANRTGDRWSYIDFHTDDTYTDYSLRLLKGPGANSDSWLTSRGLGTLYIQTQEAAPIRFNTTSATRMTIAANGNIGIGTGSPSGNLHIQGASFSSAGIAYSALFDHAGSLASGGIGIGKTEATNVPVIQTFANNHLGLLPNGGNVGIGTTSPAAALDVRVANTGVGQGGQGGILLQVRDGLDRPAIQSYGNIDGTVAAYPAPLVVRQETGTARSILAVGLIQSQTGILSSGWISAGSNITTSGYLMSSGGVYPGGGGAGGAFLGQNGDMYMPWSGNWLSTHLSDQRLKTNIQGLPEKNGLDTIMKLRPVTYEWRDKERSEKFGTQMGFIAQEVEKLYPSFINTGTMPFEITTKDGKKESVEKAKSIKYENFVVPLVVAVQEMKHFLDTDRQDIIKLKADNDNLRALVDENRKQIDRYEGMVAPLVNAVRDLKADNDNLNREIEVLKRRAAAPGNSAPSDRRLKKMVQDTDLGLDFVEKLRPVSYRMKEGNGLLNYGFIAQEVEQVLDGRMTAMIANDNDAMKTYRLKITEIIAPVVRAIQQLAQFFRELERALAGVVADLGPLKKEVEAVAAGVDERQKAIEEMRAEIKRLKLEHPR